MKFDPNDPKWTAYALDELSAPERSDTERELAASPEARRFVEEIKAVAVEVKSALDREQALALDAPRKEAIARAAANMPAGKTIRFPVWTVTAVGVAAAVFLVVLVGLPRFGGRQGRVEQVASAGEAPPRKEYTVSLAPPVPDVVFMQELEEIAAEAPTLTSPTELGVELAMAHQGMNQLVMKGAYAGRHAFGDARVRNHVEVVDYDMPVLSPSLDDFPEVRENGFIRVEDHPLSTFSIDVDTASYAVMRKFLLEGRLPPKDAIRIEELINYFPYDYAPPTDDTPFAAHLEAAACPWAPSNLLVRIALKGKEIARDARPPCKLVFLIDVSGSMSPPNRLPLVKRSLQALVKQLDERDQIAIVVYAGAAGLVLPSTRGDNMQAVLDAIDRLDAGGSTAGGAGIQLAYKVAREQFDPKAVNRVILCTDGDFNVGVTQRGDLERLIEQEAKSGVFLSVLGFGMGNYKDSTLELLSNKGNGNYAYIDDFSEARKVLVDQMMGTLVTIAKDVKIQVEFNPARVAGYRLVGYENRMLRKEDFNNDKVDAGDIGAGHTVTAFYEIIPAGREVTRAPAVDDLKYQSKMPDAQEQRSGDLLTVKLRYKQPDGDVSSKLEFPLAAEERADAVPSRDFRFAAAVAGFGMLLRESEYRGDMTYDKVISLAEETLGADPFGYRAEFLKLVRNAASIER